MCILNSCLSLCCTYIHTLLAPSSACVVYSGEGLHWRELCRIQHLPTKQYLAVVKDQDTYKVTLKERSTGTEFEADTTFRLIPVIEDDDDVNFGSYTRIYHVHTDTWLHALKGIAGMTYSLHTLSTKYLLPV